LIGSLDFYVYALDASNGAVRWKYETGLGVSSSPAVSGEATVIGSKDGYLYALEIATGKLRWKTRASPGDYGSGSVRRFGDLLAIGWSTCAGCGDGKHVVASRAGVRSAECAGNRGTNNVPDEQRGRSVCAGIKRLPAGC
jgi:FOG: WD40-like repeat